MNGKGVFNVLITIVGKTQSIFFTVKKQRKPLIYIYTSSFFTKEDVKILYFFSAS